MKKINLKGLDMDLYTETLSNGLEIYMLPYQNKKNYHITFATHFGSDVLEFVDVGKKNYKPPLGIAHFLEHKMFEQESGEDPFTFFSSSGTDSNACTTYDSTEYYCYGSKDFNKNLEYLLRFVTHPYYTDENVQKEKGIIAEEIKMYRDIPDFKLEMKLRECLYKNHPRRLDIAGSVSEIKKITKEDLYTCYNNFYIPSNMFVLITGNFDKEIALEIIKNELDSNVLKKVPKIKKVTEPVKVEKDILSIKGDIEVDKLAIGLKLSNKNIELSDVELQLYLNMLTTILFGASSEFRENARLNKLYSDISIGWESVDEFRTFYMTFNTTKMDKLIDLVKDTFKNIKIEESDFNRIKKVWKARQIKTMDNMEWASDSIYYDIIKYNKVINNKLDLIKNMKVKVLNDLIKKIDFNNMSIVKMTKK